MDKKEISYFTEQGLKALKEELEYLKNVERPKISKQIAEARDKGDISENAEYDAAKDAQGMLEMKMSKIEEQIMNARIVDKSKINSSKITLLSTVKIKDVKSKKEMIYTIVPENEANIKSGKISIKTPIAKGLLGKTVGEKVEIEIPSGKLTLEIIEILI